MNDISTWLERLGLDGLVELFRANDVTAEVLPELTDDDLRELGLSLGHRRLLLRAIRSLDEGEVDAGGSPSTTSHASCHPASRTGPERRHLTVMFVDLVGSTAMSARLDPEEMSEVIRGYQNLVAGEIGRFDGYVARFMGDGVLAYFGWPRAHEDDAERAVRAALAVMRSIARATDPQGPLAARAGIASGLVVVGELVGEGAAQEETVVGETPNLAARFQTLAEPGEVVIAESTRRLLGERFELADLGAKDVKGLGEPVGAFAVRGELSLQSRFEAHSRTSSLPMVGRDPELALLLERWQQARSGEGQGVLVVGEAGIGKSRITAALLDAIAEEPHTCVRLQCSPFHVDSVLWPVIDHLRRAVGLARDEPTEASLTKVEALLARAGTSDTAPLIADLLGLDGASRYGALDLAPRLQRMQTLAVLCAQLFDLATRRPVLVVLEDTHWIDPTTLELMEQCLDQIAAAPMLILSTTRPGQQLNLAAHPRVTRLTLDRLSRAGVESVITQLGGKILPAEVIDAIVGRTDGVPLFAEELTKVMLESGDSVVPASLHDSLMARLDRISSAKEIAQAAACIGREFPHGLLSAIAERPESDLRAGLDRLVESELIFRRGVAPDASYTFKHALVRDVAYESLLKSRRRKIHAAIFEALQRESDVSPEILARHAEDAGRDEIAIAHWLQAAERAENQSAYREAASHYQHLLPIIERLPQTPESLARSIDTRLQLRNCLVPLGQARRALVFAREAMALADQLDDGRRQARAASYIAILLWHMGRPGDALPFGRQAAGRALQLPDIGLRVSSNFFLGQIRHALGGYVEARQLYEQVVSELGGTQIYDCHDLPFLPAAHARSWLTLVLAELGEFDTGARIGAEAVQISEQADQPFSLQQACWALGNLHLRRGEWPQALALVERSMAVTHAWGLEGWSAAITSSLGTLAVLTGKMDEGTSLLEQAVVEMEHGRNSSIWLGQASVALARSYLAAGRAGDAATRAARALELARERNQVGDEAWALQVLGEIAIQGREPSLERAEESFRQSLQMAQRLGMRPLVAHCAFGLSSAHEAAGSARRAVVELERAITLFDRLAMREPEARARRRLADLTPARGE